MFKVRAGKFDYVDKTQKFYPGGVYRKIKIVKNFGKRQSIFKHISILRTKEHSVLWLFKDGKKAPVKKVTLDADLEKIIKSHGYKLIEDVQDKKKTKNKPYRLRR